MRRRRFIGTCAVALGAAGCRRERPRTIAVIPKGRALLYWQTVHAGAARAAKEAGVEIIWKATEHETDYAGQVQIVEAMINRRVAAIVLAPLDKVVLAGPVERAMRRGVPVIVMDSPVDTEMYVSCVSTDNYGAGRLAAERMGAILKGQGKVAMVMCQPGSASTMAREDGFTEAISEKFPRVEIVDRRYGMADIAKSLAVAENMLTAHPALDAIFASNETGSVGAAQALKSRAGSGKAVKLVGFDSSPALIEGLKSGLIDSLFVQHPFKMGYEAVMSAVKKLRGESMAKINELAARMVTRDNLDDPEVQAQLNPELKF
ncbi:MAG: substrate-binding domain-containing protein [Acidobacteriales bacterium]|nr:substrate-binding domain-containing protein [Terriglobales bacterium]